MELSGISFNIRCCDDSNGNAISERAPRLNEAVSPYDADLIGFQEYTPGWEEYIKQYFGEKYDMFNKYRAEENLESTPVLWKKSKFNCIKTGYFWLSDTPEVRATSVPGNPENSAVLPCGILRNCGCRSPQRY